MTPERAEAIIRAMVTTIGLWHDELEVIDAMRRVPTPAVQHLLSQMAQTKLSLEQLIKRDDEK